MKKVPLPIYHIEQFKSASEDQKNFYIEKLEDHVVSNGFINRPHKHDFYLIVFFLQGNGLHTVDFIEYPIRPNTIFFMSPGQVHSWIVEEGTKGYIIFFKPEFYNLNFNHKRLYEFPFISTLIKQPVIQLTSQNIYPFKDLLVKMHDEFLQHGSRKWEVICSYLDIVLLKMTEIFGFAENLSESSYLAGQLKQIELLVEKEYKSHRPIDHYAKTMALSSVQLNRLCRKNFNKSIGQLIQERLILEAKRLLVHSTLSINEISGELNFSDASYFNRFFKKMTGEPPEAFRQKINN